LAFHRIYSIPIKQEGNNLLYININNIAVIQITVRAINHNILHSTGDKDIKIYILLEQNHYDSIVNISEFLGAERRMYRNAYNSSPECKKALQNTKFVGNAIVILQ